MRAIINESVSNKEYLDGLAAIVIAEGSRDTYVVAKRIKQLNSLQESDVAIAHSENNKGKCTVYYFLKSNLSVMGVYEFKLGKLPKTKRIYNILNLGSWLDKINHTIHKQTPTPSNVKDEIIKWIRKYDCKEKEQFLSTLRVHYKYTGQIIVFYREYNGELIKLKPILRLYEKVTVDELIDFAKNKSKELWDREFTCNVEMVNTYWKQQLGVYFPDQMTIKFSEYQNALHTREKILDTMLHEMVHWHLHTTGKNYSDEDFEFIEECLKVGCGLSKASSAQKAYREYSVHTQC